MLDKEFKTITLNNGQKKLTIVFSDKKYKLLSTFFFVEIGSFEDWIKENINDVLQGKDKERNIYGNICELVIQKENTTIYDMLAEDEDDMENKCSISTQELLSLINEWDEQKKLLNN